MPLRTSVLDGKIRLCPCILSQSPLTVQTSPITFHLCCICMQLHRNGLWDFLLFPELSQRVLRGLPEAQDAKMGHSGSLCGGSCTAKLPLWKGPSGGPWHTLRSVQGFHVLKGCLTAYSLTFHWRDEWDSQIVYIIPVICILLLPAGSNVYISCCIIVSDETPIEPIQLSALDGNMDETWSKVQIIG